MFFRYIFVVFRVICLVIKRNFVYLRTERDVDIWNHPEYINVNKLKISRNALNLNVLRLALRKNAMPKGKVAIES